MDRRTILIAVVTMLAGIALGASAILVWQGRHHRTLVGTDAQRGSSAQLGATVLSKVSSHFVAHRREKGGGIVFYDQPKPYGDWLCRVNRYFVPEKTLTGKMALEQDWWADDLEVAREYGVWRRPTLGHLSDAERDRACHAYRNFDHLYTASNSGDPERAAYLMDRILTDLHANKLKVPVSCEHVFGNGEIARCDGMTILRSMTLNDLSNIEPVSEHGLSNGMRRVDRLLLASELSGQHPTLRQLLVESEQRYGEQSAIEPELVSIRFVLEDF